MRLACCGAAAPPHLSDGHALGQRDGFDGLAGVPAGGAVALHCGRHNREGGEGGRHAGVSGRLGEQAHTTAARPPARLELTHSSTNEQRCSSTSVCSSRAGPSMLASHGAALPGSALQLPCQGAQASNAAPHPPQGSGRSVSRLMPMTEVMVLMAATPSHPAARAVCAGRLMSVCGCGGASESRRWSALAGRSRAQREREERAIAVCQTAAQHAATGCAAAARSTQQPRKHGAHKPRPSLAPTSTRPSAQPTCDVGRHLCPHRDRRLGVDPPAHIVQDLAVLCSGQAEAEGNVSLPLR